MARVLVADDDLEVLESLAVLLHEAYDVVTVENGLKALQLLDTQHFDVLVLDLVMPLLDGEGVIERMRESGIDVPVVLTSASADVRATAARLGIDQLQKPFDSAQLVAKIELALKKTASQ